MRYGKQMLEHASQVVGADLVERQVETPLLALTMLSLALQTVTQKQLRLRAGTAQDPRGR
jgi:hypothetical protein